MCLKRRQKAWSFRLLEEAKVSSSISFNTFTYEETPLSENGFPTLNKLHFQNFLKKLRKKTHNKIKYYACGEYGTETHRPHYHAIMYNLPQNWIDQSQTILQDTWKHGTVDIGTGTDMSINYVTGYINKTTNEINNKNWTEKTEENSMEEG